MTEQNKTVIMPGEFGTPKAQEVLAQWAKDTGYVKLAENQTLPINMLPNANDIAEGYLKGAGLPTLFSSRMAFFNGCVAQRYRDTEEGWRKVALTLNKGGER